MKNIWIRTPLIYSKPLSDIAGKDVYLKLENTQPSGSFKLRGISHLCQERISAGCTELVGSSGGNAGLALAYSCYKLGFPCHIFVPNNVAPRMLKKIESYGAKVTATAHDLHEANEQALAESRKDPSHAYIHPYDDPMVWEGHSYMLDEIKDDLEGVIPSTIVLSVGGGGMLMGILQGLDRAGKDWKKIPILAMETVGAECFHLSIKEDRLVEISPTSIAKTLGARSVAPKLLEKCKEHNIISRILEDKEAAIACVKFADDHGFMVEPACGVTLASVYSKVLPSALEGHKFSGERNVVDGPIVLIVCGGSDVSQDILQHFKETYGN